MTLNKCWGAVAALVLLVCAVRGAHVTIRSTRIDAGRYGKIYGSNSDRRWRVATIGAELDVPEGVIVESLQVPVGWSYELSRADDRIVAIRWQTDIKPGEFIEVGFVAKPTPGLRDRLDPTAKIRRRYGNRLD